MRPSIFQFARGYSFAFLIDCFCCGQFLIVDNTQTVGILKTLSLVFPFPSQLPPPPPPPQQAAQIVLEGWLQAMLEKGIGLDCLSLKLREIDCLILPSKLLKEGWLFVSPYIITTVLWGRLG